MWVHQRTEGLQALGSALGASLTSASSLGPRDVLAEVSETREKLYLWELFIPISHQAGNWHIVGVSKAVFIVKALMGMTELFCGHIRSLGTHRNRWRPETRGETPTVSGSLGLRSRVTLLAMNPSRHKFLLLWAKWHLVVWRRAFQSLQLALRDQSPGGSGSIWNIRADMAESDFNL